MAIEFLCSGCSNTLRVPDEHAGKHARCPQCSSVNSIPTQSQQPAPTPIEPNQPAGNLFDSVSPQQPQQKAHVNPYAGPVRTAGQPQGYSPHQQAYPQPSRGYYAPHRGGLILTLGILSFFCNFFLIPSILAWVLGSSDLKEMKAGRMDPSGQGITTAGMVLGIIATSLVILVILFYVVIFIIGISAAAAGGF